MRRSRSRRSLFTWLVMLASRERTCKDKNQVSLAAETVLSRTALSCDPHMDLGHSKLVVDPSCSNGQGPEFHSDPNPSAKGPDQPPLTLQTYLMNSKAGLLSGR